MMLVKGCQKKMIRLSCRDSRLFEEAFFVLRDAPAPPPGDDMLAEANRILEERSAGRARVARPFWVLLLRASLFLGGVLCGVVGFLLCLATFA